MVGTSWRFTYTDSNSDKQIIAELGQDTGASKIQNLRYILSRKNPWIMKVFADPSTLQNFPTEVGDFESSEPEILFEEYDGSWKTRGRFYSASQTNEGNEYAIQLLDFYHKLMNQEASVSSTNTHIVDAMEKALPNGYVVDAPPEADVSGGYPSVGDYSAQNTQLRKVYRELTRDNNWALFFLPEQDSNGNWKVRFEPDGFGGTVDTLDTGTDQSVQIKQWSPPKKRNLITKARVEGVDSDGNRISATAENTAIRDKYLGTRGTDHSFEEFKVGYLEGQTEADKKAENKLKPGPDVTELKDEVVVKNTIYPQDVVNDSFGLIDSFRSIDDTFTCEKQENFYPANQSVLHLEFESEKLEKAAEGEENLRDERARLYPEDSTNVGNQSLTTGDAFSNTGKKGGVGDNNDRDNDLSNVRKKGGIGDNNDRDNDLSNVAKIGDVYTEDSITTESSDQELRTNISVSGSSWSQVSILNTSGLDVLYNVYRISIWDIDSNVNWFKITVSDDSEGSGSVLFMDTISNAGNRTFTDGAGGVNQEYVYEKTFIIPTSDLTKRTSSHYLSFSASGSTEVDFQFQVGEISHDHSEDIDTSNQSMGLTDDVDTDNQSMGLTDDIETDDQKHGGGTGDNQHGGSTEDNVNVKTATENNTSR